MPCSRGAPAPRLALEPLRGGEYTRRAMGARILRLPSRGRLLVCTDLQGNLRDFERMLVHFERAGPDAVLVFTGDLIHGPDPDTVAFWPEHLGTPYEDASGEVMAGLAEAQARWPGRVHALLGNHEHAHVGGPAVSKFYENEAAALEARLGPEGTRKLREQILAMPLVAVAPNGAVMTHAAPAAELTSPEDLEQVPLDTYAQLHFTAFARLPLLGRLLWARMATPDRAADFLAALGGTFSLYGHDVVREGYARDERNQLCFSTSFGLFDDDKVYVELDLETRYADATELEEGVEIRKLWEP